MTEPFALQFIVGLGNPGQAYTNTRHNAGFWLVDAVAQKLGLRWKHEKTLQGELATVTLAGRKLWLFKPLTFMNLSGNAVTAAIHYFRVPVSTLLVAHDELDLNPGQVKLKFGGGHAGHNGLRSIHSHLGANYWRLRLGIGHPGDRDKVADWVLDSAGKNDQALLQQSIGHCVQHVEVLLSGDLAAAQRHLHTAVKPPL